MYFTAQAAAVKSPYQDRGVGSRYALTSPGTWSTYMALTLTPGPQGPKESQRPDEGEWVGQDLLFRADL